MVHDNSIPDVMDHGHAHPSHDFSPVSFGNNDRQQTPYRPLSFLGTPNTSSPLCRSPRTPLDIPLSLPQRRLQLRNAGFRAPRLPSHQLSTRISDWFSDKDDSHIHHQKTIARNRENTPPTTRRQNTRGHSPAGRILQEITNSSRCRSSQINTSVPVQEYRQELSPSYSSWYHDAPSTSQSPVLFATGQDNLNEMKLGETSGDAQRSPSPLSSPLAPRLRGQNKRSTNLHTTCFQVSEHIVFLETKLEEVEKSQYSPRSGLPLKDKIKALSAENNRLQEMLAELEHQFETKLRESVEHKTGLEMSLRWKVKQLEDEIRSKDSIIQDIEYRNDASQRELCNAQALRATIERLEAEKQGLEETNRSLEKRNNVITELLGQSPSRSHHGFELPTPVRASNKRTPRPRSMIPRLPSSPTHGGWRRPRSPQTYPSPFQHGYVSLLSALDREHDHLYNGGESSVPEKVSDDLSSVDSGLGDSCSVRSGIEPVSKRSSMYSFVSTGAPCWGLPLAPSPTEGTLERSSRKRKARRFISGSTQLKPLVLPTLNVTSGSHSPSHLPAINSTADHQDFSVNSSNAFICQSYETPTQPRQRSKTWAGADTLKASGGITEVQFADLRQVPADGEASQSPPGPAQIFDDLQNQLNFNPAADQSLPFLLEDVIVEEDSTVFLNSQVKDAEDRSFSSLLGDFSNADSQFDGPCTHEDTKTTEFLSFRRPFAESCLAPEKPKQANLARATGADGDAHPDANFSPTIPLGGGFPNPLVSAHVSTEACFQHLEGTLSGNNQLGEPGEQALASTESSSVGCVCKTPVHRSSSGSLENVDRMLSKPHREVKSRRKTNNAGRPQSPLDLLQRKGSPTGPLTSLTNRTVFGTISWYTSLVRDLRQEPIALARRVIANAWCSNWKRFGRLSWWVLGLFVGPRQEQQVSNREGWEAYDGEDIARREQERSNGPGPAFAQKISAACSSKLATSHQSTKAGESWMKLNAQSTSLASQNEGQDAPEMKAERRKPRNRSSWAKSLYLWGKFSIAIMLAVGGAVIHGPGEMLKDCDGRSDAALGTRTNRVRNKHQPCEDAEQESLINHPPEFRKTHANDDNVDDDTLLTTSRTITTARTAGLIACSSSWNISPSIPPPSPTLPILVSPAATSAYSSHKCPNPPSSSSACKHEDDRTRGAAVWSTSLHSTTIRNPLFNNPRVTPQLLHSHQQPQPDWSFTEDQLLLHRERAGEGESRSSDLGTLKWMQSLTVEDFEGQGESDKTVRPSPNRNKKRLRRLPLQSFRFSG